MDNRFDYASYNAFVVASEAYAQVIQLTKEEFERSLAEQKKGGVLYDRVIVTFPIPRELVGACALLTICAAYGLVGLITQWPATIASTIQLVAMLCIVKTIRRITRWRVTVTTRRDD